MTTANPSANCTFGYFESIYTNRECAFAHIGSGLTDTEASKLNTIVEKFNIALDRFILDPAAEAFIDAAGITSTTEIVAINDLVLDLKANNLWTKMTAIYPIVGGTEAAHELNLKSASFTMNLSGSWSESSQGMFGVTSLSKGDTGIAANSLNINSHHMSVYINNGSGALNGFDGTGSSNNILKLGHRAIKFFSAGATVNPNVSFSSGAFLIGTRQSSTATKIFGKRDANAFGQIGTTSTTTPVSLPSTNIKLGGDNAGDSTEFSQYAWFSVGSGLTDTDCQNLYNIVDEYQTKLARVF
jgi:hypothetical protein